MRKTLTKTTKILTRKKSKETTRKEPKGSFFVGMYLNLNHSRSFPHTRMIYAIMPIVTGCSAAWLAHLLWEQGVVGSNPTIPTKNSKKLSEIFLLSFFVVQL